MIGALQKIETELAGAINLALIDGFGVDAQAMRGVAHNLRVLAIKLEAQAEMVEQGLDRVEVSA